ncbi:hypothetical protein CHRYSEOSP005_14930 [Chryseobacterium sp. Alg-005]|uniref:hypothetical protein n=1 Tax=Chryseobacterium sp. Alg-005 TaxID=3159516 RepID=UPI0035557136
MCKCEQTTGLNIALRDAFSLTTSNSKFVVWESKNKEIFVGPEKKAQRRLKEGNIDCYFIPKQTDNVISFEIVEKPPLPELNSKKTK